MAVDLKNDGISLLDRGEHSKKDINPSINFNALEICLRWKSAAASDLKFTKRNYNEALLIREATQER